MSRAVLLTTLLAATTAACSEGTAKTSDTAAAQLAVAVAPVAATEQPIARFIRVTGTLTAEEQADVAAETAGRVVATPVERGTAVAQGAELVRLSPVETEASVGGGAFPTARIPSHAVALSGNADDLERRLRVGASPIIGRIANGRLLLDLRSVPDAHDEHLVKAAIASLA